ncbi:hypothetical protein BRM52_03865, partial [Xanthomonas oryzae pv. oryzae]
MFSAAAGTARTLRWQTHQLPRPRALLATFHCHTTLEFQRNVDVFGRCALSVQSRPWPDPPQHGQHAHARLARHLAAYSRPHAG